MRSIVLLPTPMAILTMTTMMLPLQMGVESCCEGVAHGDAGVRCWRDMRAAGFGEKGEEGNTVEGVPNLETYWRVMQGFG